MHFVSRATRTTVTVAVPFIYVSLLSEYCVYLCSAVSELMRCLESESCIAAGLMDSLDDAKTSLEYMRNESHGIQRIWCSLIQTSGVY